MNFYVLSRKEEIGCPIGMLGGVLSPSLDVDVHKSDYGKLPWYWNPARGLAHEPFPDGLHYITADKKYRFDLRKDGGDFYLASAEFLDICSRFVVRFEDKKPVSVVSRQGKPLSDKRYSVCRFLPFPISEVADGDSRLETQGSMTRIHRLRVAQTFGQDLFTIKLLTPDIDTVFCSERFREASEKNALHGIEFTPVTEFPWPPKRDDAEMVFAHMFDDQTPKPI